MRRLKRPSSVRKRLVSAAQKNKTFITVAIIWLMTQFMSGIVKSLPDLNPVLKSVYEWIVKVDPGEHANGIDKLLYFNLLFWPIVGIGWLVRDVVLYLKEKHLQQVEVQEPFVLYKEELAAAIEAIDEPDLKWAREAISDLLFTIMETVAVNLKLRKKEYRMYFVVPDESEPDKPRLSSFRHGKIFELVDKGKFLVSEFEKILEKDASRIRQILTEIDETEVVVPGLTGEMVLFIRNPGKRLRLGLYVAVVKENVDMDMLIETFPRVAQIVSTIGFIDNIAQFVVEYNQNGGDGDEQE